MERRNECHFCDELKFGLDIDNDIYNLLHTKFGKTRVLFNAKSWYLVPSLGSFTDGYLLAILKRHLNSLYNCNDIEKKELLQLANMIERIFEEKYNKKLIFFEHGTIEESCGMNSVDHTHIHFMPFEHSIWECLCNEYCFKYYNIENLNMINKIVDKYRMKSYILFCDANHKMYLIDSTFCKYQSQFFRKVLCNLFEDKNDIWNWRTNYFIDTMYKTFVTLFDSFNKF